MFIAALFTFGRILEKIGQRYFYLTSFAVVVSGLSLLSCFSHPALLVAGTLLIGIGLGMLNLVNVTRIANANAEKGKTAAVFSMFTMSGAIIGPVIGGIAGELLGTWSVFLVFIPLYLAFAIKIHFGKKTPEAVEIFDQPLENFA